MIDSLLLGVAAGLIYGLIFLQSKKFNIKTPEKKTNFILLFGLRITGVILFFLFLLPLENINHILVLISMLITFWVVVLKKERVI